MEGVEGMEGRRESQASDTRTRPCRAGSAVEDVEGIWRVVEKVGVSAISCLHTMERLIASRSHSEGFKSGFCKGRSKGSVFADKPIVESE